MSESIYDYNDLITKEKSDNVIEPKDKSEWTN